MNPPNDEGTETAEYTLGRGIDYLGSIARMLRDLSGYSTLVYELIQNADDAAGAGTAGFDVTSDALIVWNDGQFTDCGSQELHPDQCPWRATRGERCDFHRFRSVSAGDKGRRADLTGAFGIGFTAVYQITDLPQIISSGQHWFIDETRPEDQRIRVHKSCEVCRGETGTQFILPWARDPSSEFRQRTNTPPIDTNAPDQLLAVLERVVPTAMLFLRHIRHIVLRHNSETVREWERRPDGADTVITDGGTERRWRVFDGDFTDEAETLRETYPAKLEKTADVAVAVPFEAALNGLLCAYLPTEERTGLPIHVNADFFPASDRKRLVVEGYQGEWNRAAIREAARVLADNILDVRDVCGPTQLWALLVDAHQASTNATALARDLALESFWETMEPHLRSSPILQSSEGEWVAPESASLVRHPAEEEAAGILAAIGGVFAHRDLREFCFRLPYDRVLGISQLGIATMVDLLLQAGVDHRLEAAEVPGPLASQESQEAVLRELDTLLGRAPEEARRQSGRVGLVALAPGTDGAMWPWNRTFRADIRTRTLFGLFADDAIFLDENRLPTNAANLSALSPAFEAFDAVSWLAAQDADWLDEVLAEEVDVRELLAWFDARREAFLDDEDLAQQLAEMPVFPTRTGRRPLAELALPGDFIDELGLADIVDVERVGEAISLLRQLGARPLTFATYVTDFVPRAAGLSVSDAERWWRLVLLVAERLGQIEDEEDVLEVMTTLACVRIEDGGFEKPSAVYFGGDLLTRILGDYRRAFLPSTQHRSVEAFYEWVGVAKKPRPNDLIDRIRNLTADPPTGSSVAVVSSIIQYLAGELVGKRRGEWGAYAALASMTWLPARDDSSGWFPPADLYASFQEYLFQSQARFIGIPRQAQTTAAAFLGELGVRDTPSTELIVAHLLHCSRNGLSMNREVYAALNQRLEDTAIDQLQGERVILLPSDSWVSTEYVFWGSHPFGRFRYTLGDDFQRFAALLTRLGVRQHPTVEDAADVLLEIAGEFGGMNMPVEEEDDVRVYAACWRMLDEIIEEGDVPPAWFQRLGTRKVIRDPRGVLTVPARIFFDDVPGLAERFPRDLVNSLIRRPEGAWRAMRAAGVRDLSRAVTTRMLELGERGPNQRLQAVVRERLRQIGRVLDPVDPGWPTHLAARLDAVEFVSTTRLVVEYSLAAQFSVTAPPAELEAIYLPDDAALYVARNAEANWLAIGRELARAISPDTPPGSLAANLSLVLSASSVETAELSLDQAWVPRLDPGVQGEAAANVVESFGGDEGSSADGESTDYAFPDGESSEGPSTEGSDDEEADTGDRPPTGFPSGTSGDGSGGSSTTEGAPGTGSETSGEGRASSDGDHPPGPRSRLRSYVVPATDSGSTRDDRDEGDTDAEVDRAGVDHVLAFERAAGRTPVEKAHGFPGYDIESSGPDGAIERFIEVKSLSGPWDSYGVAVSPRQMAEARERGSAYWLYVVARAPSAEFAIYCIQDPASKVDQFLFDDPWILVSEAAPRGRGVPPVTLVSPDRRVPGRVYVPFYDIREQEPGSTGSEAGWVEWGAAVPAGAYLAQVLGEALDPTAARGSLVLVEPLGGSPPAPGDLVFLDLGGQIDPETGTDLAFRIWPQEADGDGRPLQLDSLNPSVSPLHLEDPVTMRVLGRVTTEPATSAAPNEDDPAK